MARPDANAPAVGVLKAGTEPDVAGPAPDGWLAVKVPGPFTAYVPSSSLTKSLDVKPGASIYNAPRADAGVIATAARGDKVEITGILGRWARISLNQSITGYISTSTAAMEAPSPALRNVATASNQAAAAPAAAPAEASGPGHPVDTSTNLGGAQYFEGRFASAKRWIGPSRPYDWELVDSSGTRLAYLDVHKLLLTEQMEKYIGHTVGVYGTIAPIPNHHDVVVTVESLQLR
jgi:hypothetical protein